MKTKTLKFHCLFYPYLGYPGVLLAAILSTLSCYAQNSTPADMRGFVNNVVEIGVSEFGFITAEDSANIYFVTVRHSLNERNYPAEVVPQAFKTAKFYNNSYRAKATKVREARIGPFSVALYKSPRPAESKWRSNYFYSLDEKKGKITTFRDKWVSDDIWYMHNAKIEIQRKAKNGIYTLKVPKDAGLARGMPLLNDQGFVAGIIAESSLGKTSIRAISMEDITEMLYLLGNNDCRYMHLVQLGQTATRCVLEELARKEAAEKAAAEEERKAQLAKSKAEKKEDLPVKEDTSVASKAITRETPKQRFVDFGLSGSLQVGPKQVNMPAEISYFKTKTAHVGIDLYLNIDRKNGRYRFTLKPGYGSFSEENDPAIWASSGNEVKIFKNGYKFVEMPVLFERQIFGNAQTSTSLGVGYAAGYVFGQQYTWTNKDAMDGFSQKVAGSSVIQQRLLAALYFYQCKVGRVGLVYAKDITAYPNAGYVLQVNGVDYMPFAERRKGSYLGLELAIRLRGSWGK